MPAELHVTSPLMRGQNIIDLQKRLIALGYRPGVPDGAYGPTTAAAVRAFQRDRHLEADGIVGAVTLAALKDARPLAAPASSETSAIAARALGKALEFIGVREEPKDSNQTLFGKWYGLDGAPWCNIFVSYCFHEGAGYTIADGFKGAGVKPGKGCAFVPSTEAWLRSADLWVGRTEPRAGDIAIYNWDGGRPNHIGIVERYLGNGEFTSIEGNTSFKNDSNGGEVMRRNRFLHQVEGFGRIT